MTDLPFLCGGEGGIRTHGGFLGHARFQDESLKPLGHLSVTA